MPVQIGAKAHYFTDPTGLLSDCHRRIEMFLGTIETVAKVIDRPPNTDVRAALESALHYFSQAAPKHTADEEVSLFPRLREIANPEVASAISQLDELQAEHRWADLLHAEVERMGVKYLSPQNKLSSEEVERFRTAIRDLRSMYDRHIRLEDHVIFPLAARVLSAQDKSAIADEMAGRRKVSLVAIGDGTHGL
jgi:iron-sulfur cluster repair protein YtfE (RIC family)